MRKAIPMRPLRIAQAQINPTVGDLAGNLELICHYLDWARDEGAELVTFPELAVSGYPPEDLLLKPRFLADCKQAVKDLAPHSRGLTVVVGYPLAQGSELYNAAAILHDGAVVGPYRKQELPNYGVFDEKRYFTPGRGCVVVDLEGIRVLVTICEDIWREDNGLGDCARKLGVHVSLNISGSPFYAGKLALRQRIVEAFARRSGSVVCYNNLVGGQDELVFDGGSLVMNPRGRLLARAKRFQSDLQLIDLELSPDPELPAPRAPHKGYRLSRLEPARPRERISPVVHPEMDRVEEVFAALVLGTRDYVSKNGFQTVVLGLSGGIDSALTAVVAVEAVGREQVVGVTMPSQYTSRETFSDAERLARNLGIRLLTVPIGRILEAYLTEMASVLGEGDLGVTAENLQARIRGNILMGLSNRFGWLVLTTGNKSETAVGYCTLYGDMAGGFAVIKDVPKTMVYELARYANQRAGRELIPQSIIERPPSAELRPDQKDTDSLPPYEVLDPILASYVEEDKVYDEVVAEGHDPEVVRRVVRMVDLNEYKRRQAPPGIKITPKAFGRDRRLPITNHYHPGWE